MKKKWLSRTLAMMMAGAMTVGLMAGCGNEAVNSSEQTVESTASEQESVATETQGTEVEESNEITYPLTSGVLELSIGAYGATTVADVYVSVDDSPWHTGLGEKTGIDIEWLLPTAGAEITTSFNLLLQEEELPNILAGASATMNLAKTVELYEDGLIYDLTEYLPKYAPDYWEYINRPENAVYLPSMMTDDGKMLGIYSFTESEYNGTYLGPVIRQDWLDECGLKAPRTLEEWENVLTVFKEKYNATLGFPMNRYSTSGGISSGTGAQAALVPRYYVNKDGKICYGNCGEEWKAMLEVFSSWVEKGLIDPDYATSDDKTTRAKALNGEIGVSITAMSQMTNWEKDAESEGTGAKWVGFQFPATEVGAPITFHNVKTRLQAYVATVTTSSTEEELIAALKFLNYGYTEEGMRYHNFGEEGTHYTLDANNEIVLTDLMTKDEGGLDAAFKKYTGAHTNLFATIQMSKLVELKNSKAAADAVSKWVENSEAMEYLLPSLVLTSEEQTRFNELNTALTSYVYETALKFAAGKESLDKYEEYEKTIYEMGLQECLDIYQAAYDRYISRTISK